MKEIDFTEDKAFKAQYSAKIDKVMSEYKKIKGEIERMLTNKVAFGIAFTTNHLNSPYDKFEYFKDIYRIFLGYVFAQVHSCSIKDKERIKIRVLCCHTINRVFEDNNAKYLQFFNNWASKREKKCKSVFEFDLFSKWIEEDSQ